MKYQIVCQSGIIEVENIHSWCQNSHYATKPLSERRRFAVRAELKDQPIIEGLYGPMWGGEENGIPVIRYEDKYTYEHLST